MIQVIDADIIFKHRENIMKQYCEHCNYPFFLFEPIDAEKSLQVRLAAFCPNCGMPEKKKKKTKGKERK